MASESEFTECVDHTAWRTRRGDLIKLYVKSASQEEPHGKNKFEGELCFDVAESVTIIIIVQKKKKKKKKPLLKKNATV